MNEITPQLPAIGTVVHYYPNDADAIVEGEEYKVLPAVVIRAFDTSVVDLSIHTFNQDAPIVLRRDVWHKSSWIDGKPVRGNRYWDWAPAQ